MKNNLTFWEILASFSKKPRDVKTVPLHGQGKWFYVETDGNNIYIENSSNHRPSVELSAPRRLDKENFDKMLSLFIRRKKGESVSYEATRTTQNQVYWYGILNEMLK